MTVVCAAAARCGFWDCYHAKPHKKEIADLAKGGERCGSGLCFRYRIGNRRQRVACMEVQRSAMSRKVRP